MGGIEDPITTSYFHERNKPGNPFRVKKKWMLFDREQVPLLNFSGHGRVRACARARACVCVCVCV